MNREKIIKLAKNSGLFVELVLERDLDWLERFAALVASAEREACAKLCDEFLPLGNKCAYAIRERGQA
jgi:hypothetical protein